MDVTLDTISKHFGKVKAVDNVSIKVNSGEFVALLGPSGCGKTTVLLMIAGIYKPTTGTIRFGERVVNELLPKDRKIGMVFQSYALYPHMSVFENIVFPLRLQRIPQNEIKRRADKMAELVQVQGLLDRKPVQLSGGQQQRVALARALIKEPDLLLLDEPLSNLDAKLRLAMRAEIKRLQKDLAHHHDLRDPRPTGGHHHGRPGRPDAGRPPGGLPRAPRALRSPQHALRRRVHRQPAHELCHCQGGHEQAAP